MADKIILDAEFEVIDEEPKADVYGKQSPPPPPPKAKASAGPRRIDLDELVDEAEQGAHGEIIRHVKTRGAEIKKIEDTQERMYEEAALTAGAVWDFLTK